ncbi:MAG: helix-turn-helix transcriptional regulator [Lentisphaeria bacterium]|nr:helix-turn-helix transcriptional regulator [Lentisphaeria bacterium]
MKIRKPCKAGAVPGSRLWGYDYGRYPIHQFKHNSVPANYLPLAVVACGDDEWHRECYRQRHDSTVFAIEYVQEGVFIFTHNGTAYRCEKGDIFIVHLGADCSMCCETEYAKKKMIRLEGSGLKQLISSCALEDVPVIRPSKHACIDRCFDDICSLSETETPGMDHQLCLYAFNLLIELAEQAESSKRPEPLQRAVEFIRSRIRGELFLDELVAYSGVSQATLHRLFARYMNTSPFNYYLEAKMNEAKTLLRARHRIKEVARQLNFSSAQYFSAEFKKRYGVSPRNYKFTEDMMP